MQAEEGYELAGQSVEQAGLRHLRIAFNRNCPGRPDIPRGVT